MSRLLSAAAPWIAAAILIVLVLSLGWCTVTAPGRERRRADDAAAEANALAQRLDAAARDAAADQRLTDAQANATLREDLTHAVQSLPDARPSDRRVALACERLRHQGTDPATVPACSRPAAAGQAATAARGS